MYVYCVWLTTKLVISFACREKRTLILLSTVQSFYRTKALVRSVWPTAKWALRFPQNVRNSCAHYSTPLGCNPRKVHLHHSFTRQPWTNGYPPRDIRARKRRPGTVRPSCNSERIKIFQINKAVWGPGFGHNCRYTIILTPKQAAYSSAQALRAFCAIKRRSFARASRRFERT